MKRIIFTLVTLSISVFVLSNSSFNKSINYQFNNATAYEGETLYLMPLTGSLINDKKYKMFGGQNHYHFFMDYNMYDEDDCFTPTMYQYKFNIDDYRDCTVAGTHKRHIEGHRFYVVRVTKIPNYTYMWVLHLRDLNTGSMLKYVYNGEGIYKSVDFEVFPFIVEKHLNYCKSLIGTNLVFATNGYSKGVAHNVIYWDNMFKTDYKTGEKVCYDTDIANWKIVKVILDKYYSCICFIVSNGKYTVKVPYNIQYQNNQPKYNVGNRVFPEKQWKHLINKYGEYHMSLIMNTEQIEEMSIEENYMACGIRYIKNESVFSISNVKDVIILFGKVTKKSILDTIKNIKDIFKECGNILFK